MFAALAFVPPQDVTEAFEELSIHVANMENFDVG